MGLCLLSFSSLGLSKTTSSLNPVYCHKGECLYCNNNGCFVIRTEKTLDLTSYSTATPSPQEEIDEFLSQLSLEELQPQTMHTPPPAHRPAAHRRTFAPTPPHRAPAIEAHSPQRALWSLQLGGFGLIRYSAFQYQAMYHNPETLAGYSYTQNYANDTFKNGYSLGASIDVLRAVRRIYGLGFMFSWTGPSSQSTLVNHVDSDFASAECGSADITNQFSIRRQFDLALMFGAQLTSKGFIYGKIGPSVARIRDNENTVSLAGIDLSPVRKYSSIQYAENKWGIVFGLGLRYFLGNRISIFTEYDYYNYGKVILPTLTNMIFDESEVGTNVLTQSVKSKFGSLRFGLNVKIF
jgi:opacity protein-like surface antigen